LGQALLGLLEGLDREPVGAVVTAFPVTVNGESVYETRDQYLARVTGHELDLALPQLGPDHTIKIAYAPNGEDPDDIFRRAGLNPDEVTIYALRHSSIVRQIKANVPIRIIAVSHDTSVRMIEQHYRWGHGPATDRGCGSGRPSE
jgi:hypothetical protein